MLFNLGGIIVLLVNELLDVVKLEISNIKMNEVLLVRELFKGYEWNRISHSESLLFGTLFLNCVKNDDIEAMSAEKTSSRRQKYRKQDADKGGK